MPVANVKPYCEVDATIGTTSVKILMKYDNGNSQAFPA